MANRCLLGVAAVAVLMAAACSSGDSSASTPTLPEDATTSTATTEAPTTTEATPTTEPTSTTEPAPTVDGDELVAIWVQAWQLLADPATTEEDLAAVATPDVAAGLLSNVQGDIARTITNYPALSPIGADGFAEINDCLISQPAFLGAGSVWFSGRVGPDDTGDIRIVDFKAESVIGCVPAELAGPAIDGYEAYWDALPQIWMDPSPLHPLVEETMTGVHLQSIRQLLVESIENGWELRGRPETHPEFLEFRSPTLVVIVDCQLVDPDRGVFLAESGERTDLIAPVAEGQRDTRWAEMRLEDGIWKVEVREGEVDSGCELAPTSQGLPVVGIGGEQ